MFETQRLANNFDYNAGIREDASSFGQRFFSIFGEINTYFYKDLLRFKTSFFPKQSLTDIIPSVYSWDISDFTFQYYSDQNNNILLPTVTGDSQALSVFTSVDDFLNSLIFDLEFTGSVSDYSLIYNSSVEEAGSILDINIPNYLYIEFTDIASFAISHDTSLSLAPNYIAKLSLEGEDIYGNPILEQIFPTVNGVYRTSNIYSKLNSLLLVNIDGPGTLKIKTLDFDLLEYISSYSIVTTSEIQTPLILDYDDDFFHIKYYLFPPQNGTRISEDKETFAKVKLLDASEEEITIRDITVSANREELYVLSENKISIYDNWINNLYFTVPQMDRTLETLLTADFMYRVSGLNESNHCYIGPSKIGKRIKDYTIYFIDPTGERLYLQLDYDFTTTPFTFVADNTLSSSETIDNFQIEFSLDKLGQWDLVIESTDFNDNEYIYVTSVLVPFLISSKDIILDEAYELISYHPEGSIYLSKDGILDKYSFIYNTALIDSFNKKLYTIENYSNLELTYV